MTLDHVIVFTAVNLDEIPSDTLDDIGFAEMGQMIMFRHYKIEFHSSSNGKKPYIHLREIGPAMDMHLRRHQFGNDEIMRKAMERPEKAVLNTKPKQKNVEQGRFRGEKIGRLHLDIQKQNVDKLQLKKMKALRDRNRGVKYGDKLTKKIKRSNTKKARKAAAGPGKKRSYDD